MSNQYADFLRQDQRLVMLRILSELPQYCSNSSVISNLLSQFGHNPSRDQVKSDLVWLSEQGLVSVNDIGSVMVATLTERGGDVAAGRSSVPGVSKPRP
ncbi:ArsR family transcriptional regulator [Pseudomonas fulva]|uniref:VpaChn25_0724 family phage protein n=1 Tax=Pseudomonas fulva TaxID=47880 RepID=UPI00201D81BA|nr:ArsR family transcriptional regulator [Pseudomonas fulva]UQY32639.1 ArsR family transcriptional regulator [Pseudomonas fulva]